MLFVSIVETQATLSSVVSPEPNRGTGPRTPGRLGVEGNAGGLNAYVSGRNSNHTACMLIDTGAFANCVSLKFFQLWLQRMTPIASKRGTEIFTSANCSPLNVVGTIRVPVTGGRVFLTTFHVIDKLSMDVILGVEFFQNNSAVLDYVHKRLSLCNGLIRVPLLTHIDFSRVVRAIRRVRIGYWPTGRQYFPYDYIIHS